MEPGIASRLKSLRRHGVRLRDVRPGSPPGALDGTAGTGATRAAPARVALIRYGQQGIIEELHGIAAEDCAPPPAGSDEVTWLHMQGAPTAEQLEALAHAFGLHPLAIEDVFHREARAKVEAFDSGLFVILDRMHRDADEGCCASPVNLFLGRNYVISIDQGPDNLVGPVRARIAARGSICRHQADYLLYALLDLVVDSAFTLLEDLGDRLEELEDRILDTPTREARNAIHYARRELILMRRAWWPQREVIATLLRDEGGLLARETRLYLRDCHDHCVIVIDFVETYREMTASLLDTYLSAVSQRMNDIMKTLTIIATIFLPLTFITSLYGMNFDTASAWNMPELRWPFGYLYALGLMAVIAMAMLVLFRRKGWLGERPGRRGDPPAR